MRFALFGVRQAIEHILTLVKACKSVAVNLAIQPFLSDFCEEHAPLVRLLRVKVQIGD